MLVEDDLAEADLLQQLLLDLTEQDCQISHELDLQKALDALSQNHFDVVLLDLSLPDNPDLESLSVIIEAAPHTPVVVLTNTNNSDIALEAVQKGAQDYLVKKNIARDQESLWRSLLYAIERKKNQEDLRIANERLRQEILMHERTQLKFQQSNQELEQFAYIASHDLKQPLSSIYSWSQLLQVRYGDRLDAKGQQYIRSVQSSVKQMTQLIEDLLTYSRVDRANSEFVEVNCKIIVHQVLNRLSSAIATTNAKITVGCLPEVYGNPLQLGQLFQNLIENALKYHREDIRPDIHISAQKTHQQWIFRCQDNGIGIEEHYFEEIFYAFRRLHSQTQYTGTGIGLAVCKKIVQRHGGKIWLESIHGKGSTFFFSLPIPPESD
ncbi:response regulator receiver sensor signal transduction histidine kinase [[Leptolyngbya] sp. PCC 7376]|uniref:sensor histidine kinase n=1 Tax=[Leptolyngbya] sp. PCC 7376 TaxID=111781 RepID=UPI00029F1084|nr:ATP-binding protein [[Leptolyngbya] sp. PCC 7376]AFY38338.1 response regulator receiver sensor signal transduction histidine kinase [[Leptolyngbya] sp. PCC 7376]